MPEELELFTIPYSVTGAAATSAVNLRPASQGTAYLLWDCYGYHDDNGGARDCYFIYTDGSTSIRLTEFAALADGTKKWLRKETGNNRPLLITYTNYLQWFVNGIGAGKKGYIGAVISKIKGIPSDVGVT